MHNKRTIVILDDHPLVAEGLRTVCQKNGLGDEVILFTEASPFLSYLQGHEADMLLIDLKLKNGADGRDVIRTLRQKQPEIKIIVLSAFDDAALVRSAYAAGANAYLIKDVSFEDVLTCIQAVSEGQSYMHPDILKLLTESGDNASPNPNFEKPRLTRQEKNVLQLIINEKTTKEIATELLISENTVESHRKNLIAKMDVRNIAGLVRKAIEWGILKGHNT